MTQQPNADRPESLLAYLGVIRRWKWVVFLSFLAVPTMALAFSLSQQKLYRASAEVLLSRQDLASALAGIPNLSGAQDASRDSQTQADLARVPEVARRVIKSVPGSPTVGEFLSESSVHPKNNSNLLLFSVTSPEPVLAARLATAYAKEFTTYRRELDTQALKAARQQLSERISSVAPRPGQDPSALYQSLIEKEQQLATLEALQGANASLIQEAQGASQTQPHPVRNTLLGIVLGIFVGVGLAFVFEALDRRVRSAEEIEKSLRLPLLGRLAAPPRRLQARGRPAMLVEPNGPHAEAFRSLRTNLELIGVGHEIKTLMVTSAIAGEGKSTTAANLAVAFARAGRRTILVDLDLRRPTVEVLFGAPRQPGVTDSVRGRAKIEEVLVTIPVLGATRARSNGRSPVDATLTVIPSGALPPNPGEFIASEGISKLLLDLQRRADVVLIDAPPLLTVGDGLVLSSQVDALMVVTHMTRIRRPLLRELSRVLDQSRARVLGFALAGAAKLESYYEYETYYRHGEEGPAEDDVPREVRPQAAQQAQQPPQAQQRSSSAGGSLR